ncbi:hypothetical protein [Haloferula sp. BvORR071]|uniref:hypothetical protein n=1 Tax=Haloferula sp. BvORR071 TaxID=1396141 RepID=UPI002240EF04|nr:hypothetical protein [Haloferula sp. BvORR071]
MIVLERPTVDAKSGKWAVSLFVLVSALLFGGVAGDWFAADLVDGSWISRALQMSGGTLAMAVFTAGLGSLIFGRNPVRWGIGMPFLVYLGGGALAVVTGREGAMTVLYGAPLFLGLAFAAGMMSTFLIDGVFPRGSRD